MPHLEVELKIKLSPTDLEKVFQSFIKKPGISAIRQKAIPRAYYDTLEMDLYKKGLSFRREDDGKRQTLKMEAGEGGSGPDAALIRKECTDALIGPEPSLAAITDAEARAAITPFLNKKTVSIFTSDIQRRSFEMDIEGGRVEIVFDVGALVLAGNVARQDFHEIEVELLAGSPAGLAGVKREIFSIAPSAEVQMLSKAVQGSRLYLNAAQ